MGRAGDQYPYVSEGAASTVAVHIAPNGYSNFHVSGRVEATNNPNDLRIERLLGHLSALVHPKPESVLVVGLGAGVTAGALTLYPEVKRIVICEIEPRVVGAANLFARENYAVLSDPRVQIVFDDARHFLATTREKFDIITSDPIHPWVRGNSILFSREYYEIVKAHAEARRHRHAVGAAVRDQRGGDQDPDAHVHGRVPGRHGLEHDRGQQATTWCCWAATSRCGWTSRRSKRASTQPRDGAVAARREDQRRRRSARDVRRRADAT